MKTYKKDRTCIKCGGCNINDIYREAAKNFIDRQFRQHFEKMEEEHIERFCENCKYYWAEQPLS